MHCTLLIAMGSRGDVQPFLGLAVRLLREGHTVRLAAPPDFAELVAAYGVDFAPMGLPAKAVLNNEGAFAQGTHSSLKDMRIFLSYWRDAFDLLAQNTWEAAQGTDVIIYEPSTLLATSVAERLGIPCVESIPVPFAHSREVPCAMLGKGKDRGPLLNWGLGFLFEHGSQQFLWQMFRRKVNQQRRDLLGLDPLPFFGPWISQTRVGVPVLYAYSPIVLPRPSDWPERIHVTGYWLLDPLPDWQPPADLLAFLRAGPPPVAIGFGSMPIQRPHAMLDLVLKALERSGQRGILLSGWSGIGKEVALPESVWRTDDIPYSWLFPRVAAVVHHGGAGTISAALRSGVPSIVTPLAFDQPFWAQRVQTLGVGPAPLPYKKLTVEHLADAIREAVTNTGMRKRAVRIGQRLQQEDGAGLAIEILCRYVTSFRHR